MRKEIVVVVDEVGCITGAAGLCAGSVDRIGLGER